MRRLLAPLAALAAGAGDDVGALHVGGAFLGNIAALVIGLPILLAGMNGPLHVMGGPSVALDARGIRISF